MGSISDQGTQQNHPDVEDLPAGGGEHSDHGTQNHPHVEDLPAGGGEHSDYGTQNHPHVEDLPAGGGSILIKVHRTILIY